MSDQTTSINDLREIVRHFVDARDWQQFHSPKNLSMALTIEAGELMEHFQWLTIEQSRRLKHDQDRSSAVGEEMADILCYLLALANELEIDLSEAMRRKMQKNESKYPVESFRGRFGPDDPAC